jgi:hypothetical protein
MYDVFLICPVRNATDEQKESLMNYIQSIESDGLSVYYPARDTDQNDDRGYRICSDNRKALRRSKKVYLFWDGKSDGSKFDLGMAWYGYKKLWVVNPETLDIMKPGKSFDKMVYDWMEK